MAEHSLSAVTTAAEEGPASDGLSGNKATFTNIICAVIGAGILAVPKGLQSAGWSGPVSYTHLTLPTILLV